MVSVHSSKTLSKTPHTRRMFFHKTVSMTGVKKKKMLIQLSEIFSKYGFPSAKQVQE